MKKIAFLGAKKIGYKCFKSLLDLHIDGLCKIVGVISRSTRLDTEETIFDLCEKYGINCLTSLDEYLDLPEVDITISVQHDEILKKKHIEKASEIAVNLHLAPLPEYRGCNQFSFAIIDEAKWFGATLHEMNENIDAGDILFEERFRIDDKKYWVKELYDETIKVGAELFDKKVEKFLRDQYKRKSQKDLVGERKSSIHFRDEIQEIKKIDLNWERDKIDRHIRATSMPGFEPPFTFIEGKKVHFKI
ncbi:formyltransferase family protein [Fodinibius sp. AD559]|uniref:formyltransferase family protein n=1 Tax=Fodinibius sp. AD559 TaxID=3424179 RepID=UPI004046AF98